MPPRFRRPGLLAAFSLVLGLLAATRTVALRLVTLERAQRVVTPAATAGNAPADWGAFMIAWHSLDQGGTAVRPNRAGPTSCGGTGSNCDYRPFAGGSCTGNTCDTTVCSGGPCSVPVDSTSGHFAEGTGANLFGSQGNGLGKLMGCAMPTCAGLNPSAGQNLTWGLWARPTTTGHYMDLQDADASAVSVGGYYHDLDPAGHHVCLVAEDHGGSGTEWEYFAQSPGVVPVNTLSHLACRWDRSSRTLSNVIDGVVVQACGPGQGSGNCGCYCNGPSCGGSPCNNTTPNYTPSVVNRYLLSNDSTAWVMEGNLDEDFNVDGLMLPSDVCRIRALGIQGTLGWCDGTDPTQYKVCSADADCRDATHVTGVCDLGGGCTPGATCRCTGRLSGGPTGCRTIADLPACNVSRPVGLGGSSPTTTSSTLPPTTCPGGCDDGDACTVDTCLDSGTCVHQNVLSDVGGIMCVITNILSRLKKPGACTRACHPQFARLLGKLEHLIDTARPGHARCQGKLRAARSIVKTVDRRIRDLIARGRLAEADQLSAEVKRLRTRVGSFSCAKP